jgi:hypothetical protein
MNTLVLRNPIQVILWKHEITGQLSDGHWENTRPYDHWREWCNAQVTCDVDKVGRNFWVRKDNYVLNSKALLDVVGQRMLNYVNLYYGLARMDYTRDWKQLLADCDKIIPLMGLDGELKEPGPNLKGEYWDNIRAELEKLDVYGIQKSMEGSFFTRKNLIWQLKDMRSIMKIWRQN